MTSLSRMTSIVAAIAVAIAISVSLSACGSSKPKYCSDVTDLQTSVSGIDLSGGVSSVKTQLQDIESETHQLIASARSDFPQQTSDIGTALNRLTTSGQAAVAQVDPEQLYYLRTRGLREEVAKQLVIEGFLSALIERFEPGVVRELLGEALEHRLGLVLAG